MTSRPRCALPVRQTPRPVLFAIKTAGRPEKDFVSWAHAYETWEMMMELRHLRYFVAVADAGSLTVAAEQKLHTSQPSLSRQIRDLEQEVGVQLMTRSAHGVELTSAGKAFLEHARMALLQAEAAKEAALRAAQPARPTFALGFLSGAEIGLLPEVDRILRDEFPGIEIRLSSDYSPVLAKTLMRRRLDAAFMRPEESMGDLSYRRLRTITPANVGTSAVPGALDGVQWQVQVQLDPATLTGSPSHALTLADRTR